MCVCVCVCDSRADLAAILTPLRVNRKKEQLMKKSQMQHIREVFFSPRHSYMGTSILEVFFLLCVCVRKKERERDHSWAAGTGLVVRAIINRASILAGLLTVDLSAFL